jgi:rRNA maturation endonuclease Nob1
MPERWVPPGTADPSLRMAQCWRCHTKYEVQVNEPLFPCEVCGENVLVPRETEVTPS